jgi:hypothetical protein
MQLARGANNANGKEQRATAKGGCCCAKSETSKVQLWGKMWQNVDILMFTPEKIPKIDILWAKSRFGELLSHF